jgi:protein-export membrane protein SecD
MLNISPWRIIAVTVALVWSLIYAAPNVLPAGTLPDFMKPVNLGLDLRGGSHLLLEVDSTAIRAERLNKTAEEMGDALSKAKPRIGYTGRAVVAGAARLTLTDPTQMPAALAEINRLNTPVDPAVMGGGGNMFDVTTLPDGSIEMRLTDEAIEHLGRDAVRRSIEVIRKRVDESGTAEISILPQGADRIVVQAPGEQDPESLKRRIGQTAKMTFHMVDNTVSPEDIAAGRVPPGTEIMPQDDTFEPLVAVRKRVEVDGDNLQDAQGTFDGQSRQPVVSFRFDGEGGRKFCSITTKFTGQRFATVLDGKVITAPRINEPICQGGGQITGNFTAESAAELAVLLRAGALPAPLNVIEQRSVGAEMGQDAINAGAVAGVIAAIAILSFMILSYGVLFGGFACLALAINFAMIIAAMSVFQATLTMPGIAGLILTLAIAVDANVLIYERMRDEQKLGRSPALAIDAGFGRAMVTIIDANLTTILAALILFQFGAGPVRGFAWTLSIGTVTSVFTAVLVTQILISIWLRTTRPKTLPI